MKRKITKKEKRRLTFLVLTFIGIIAFMAVSIIPNCLKIMDNKTQISLLEEEYTDLLEEEENLKANILKFQDPDYIERYAKENYSYTSEDDYIIRIK